MKTTVHIDTQIGLVMDGVTVVELPNALGGTYWKATAPIGSIFGSPVHGECKGIGATREQALQRLKEDQRQLAESLWA